MVSTQTQHGTNLISTLSHIGTLVVTVIHRDQVGTKRNKPATEAAQEYFERTERLIFLLALGKKTNWI